MVTLEDLLTCLKTRDVSRHAMKTYKRITKAQLLAIDNATLFPLKREDVMLLFKLVNEFQEKTSLIVTANYSLTEWLAIPGEEAVAAALLDRLLYCCEIIQLSRNSYRMENRKTIFSNVDRETVEAINLFAGTDIDIDEKEEVIDMCKAWEDQKNEGREEGRELGERQKIISLIVKKLQKDKSVAEIADDLEEKEEVIAPIYEAALSMKPDYDVEKIYELLEKNKKLA